MPKSKSTKPKPSPKQSSAASRYKALLNVRFGSEVTLGALFAELIGTFILASAVLITSGNIFIAGLTVIVLAMALSRLSGGHINPAVTVAMVATRQVSWLRGTAYIVAQLIGAMAALLVVTQFVQSTPLPSASELGMTPEMPKVFALETLAGEWRPFLAELLGATVFGVGLGAAVLGKKEGMEFGFIVGGSLFLGLLLAAQGSSSVLNPAVALGLNAYQTGNGWVTFAVFALAPVLGVTAGAWLYKLLQWDIDDTAKAAQ